MINKYELSHLKKKKKSDNPGIQAAHPQALWGVFPICSTGLSDQVDPFSLSKPQGQEEGKARGGDTEFTKIGIRLT